MPFLSPNQQCQSTERRAAKKTEFNFNGEYYPTLTMAVMALL